MAEEDLIFGKNRHFFGGIEPSNMVKFEARKRTTSSVNITAILPEDTIIDGQTLCTVKGAVIRAKEGEYPKDEFDGVLVADIEESGSFVAEMPETTEGWYYAAFPYSAQGVYNRNKANRSAASKHYLFGYDLVNATANPSTRVTYPSDVDNAAYTPAGMDYTADEFNYGSWGYDAGETFMPRPCMLKYDGTVDHYLNPNDYTKKVDGSASSAADASFGGNAMMEWSKIYTKRWEENGVYHFRCSDEPHGDGWDCWCNYDINNKVIDHFYTAIYLVGGTNGKVRSISSINSDFPASPSSNNYSANVQCAQANGSDWYIEVLADRLLIQDLLVMMARSTDSQTAYGKGASQIKSGGTMDTKGMFWGDQNWSGVKVFGMEHLWGALWRYTAGWMLANKVQKVKLTRGTHDGSTATDYNTTGSGYISVSDANLSSTGHISAMKTESYGRLPKTLSGSSSTYEIDYVQVGSSASNSTYMAYCGGVVTDSNDIGGLFFAMMSYTVDIRFPSSSRNTVQAALSCKPRATT
jgi:archaellum component FlaF (FlaF/FlaG flagellin family)